MSPRLYWIGAVAILTVWIALVPHRTEEPGIDLEIYQHTITAMRGGEGYYAAMYDALVSVQAPPTQPRSYRLPTLFWVWRWTGLSWLLVLAVILLTGWELALLAHPVVGVIGAAYLATLARPPGLPAQYGWVEFWALPLVLAAMLAMRSDRWALACVAVLAAALTRELCAPLLVSGAVAAAIARRPIWTWGLAAAGWAAFYMWHAGQAIVVPSGSEESLLGTGGIRAALWMSAPALGIVGLAVIVVALWRARFASEWWLTLPLVVGIPLVGFFANRGYWGILVFPVALGLLGVHQADATPAMLPTDAPASAPT